MTNATRGQVTLTNQYLPTPRTNTTVVFKMALIEPEAELGDLNSMAAIWE